MSAAKQIAQTLAAFVPGVQKLAAEAQRRATAAPKPTDPANVEKVAGDLVTSGWIPADRKADALKALGTHEGTLDTLRNLALKSAEELGRKTDARLAAGEAVGTVQTKQAGDDLGAADQKFLDRMTQYRVKKI